MAGKGVSSRARHTTRGGRTSLMLNEKTLSDFLKESLKESPDAYVSIADLVHALLIGDIDKGFWGRVEAFAIREGLRYRYLPDDYCCQFWKTGKDLAGQKIGQI